MYMMNKIKVLIMIIVMSSITGCTIEDDKKSGPEVTSTAANHYDFSYVSGRKIHNMHYEAHSNQLIINFVDGTKLIINNYGKMPSLKLL